MFTLEDALHVVPERARLIAAVPAGRMIAVAAPEERIAAALAAAGSSVDVAALNGPSMTVLSGPPAEIEAVAARLADEGVACRTLRSAHAFHSRLLQPAREKLAAVLDTVPRRAPSVTVISNLTGRPLTAEQATSTSYWADQLVSPVRFADGVRHCVSPGRGRVRRAGRPARRSAGWSGRTWPEAPRPPSSAPCRPAGPAGRAATRTTSCSGRAPGCGSSAPR